MKQKLLDTLFITMIAVVFLVAAREILINPTIIFSWLFTP